MPIKGCLGSSKYIVKSRVRETAKQSRVHEREDDGGRERRFPKLSKRVKTANCWTAARARSRSSRMWVNGNIFDIFLQFYEAQSNCVVCWSCRCFFLFLRDWTLSRVSKCCLLHHERARDWVFFFWATLYMLLGYVRRVAYKKSENTADVDVVHDDEVGSCSRTVSAQSWYSHLLDETLFRLQLHSHTERQRSASAQIANESSNHSSFHFYYVKLKFKSFSISFSFRLSRGEVVHLRWLRKTFLLRSLTVFFWWGATLLTFFMGLGWIKKTILNTFWDASEWRD